MLGGLYYYNALVAEMLNMEKRVKQNRDKINLAKELITSVAGDVAVIKHLRGIGGGILCIESLSSPGGMPWKYCFTLLWRRCLIISIAGGVAIIKYFRKMAAKSYQLDLLYAPRRLLMFMRRYDKNTDRRKGGNLSIPSRHFRFNIGGDYLIKQRE